MLGRFNVHGSAIARTAVHLHGRFIVVARIPEDSGIRSTSALKSAVL